MAPTVSKRLGELLCERSYLAQCDLDSALAEQSRTKCRLGQILLELGYVNEVQTIGPDVIELVPAELVSKHNVLPLWQQDGRLGLAMVNPFDRQVIEELRMVAGLSVRRYLAQPAELEQAVLKYYGSNVARMLENLAPAEKSNELELDNGEFSAAKLYELARKPSLVNLVNLIVLEAIEARASDVHIEPFERQVKIKYRVDGMLLEKAPSAKRLQAAIISRIKVMAGMNIAERFVPQDGHIEFMAHNGKVDIRVSTVPTIYGESVTMRILDRSASLLSLEDLGMNDQVLAGFNHCLHQSHGMVLVTGPTGSGKTTTLYAALNKIYTPSLKFVTIEDPVEYQLDGIIQMPVNPKRGLTFATGLRHIVRQDPDIIMVGEIRDRETAEISIRAAPTGHLVFSTLHTNDAPGAVTRLIDMGAEPFLLASSLEAVLAQRLVRMICPDCKQRYAPDENLLRRLSNSIELKPNAQFHRGAGCSNCMQTGMRGRTGIFELLQINDTLRQLIANKPTTDDITKAAPENHVGMRHDGIAKVVAGVTTPEEVLRVTQGADYE